MQILEHLKTDRGEFFILTAESCIGLRKGDPFTDGKNEYTVMGIELIRGSGVNTQEKVGIEVEPKDPWIVKEGYQTNIVSGSRGYTIIEVLEFLKGWHVNDHVVKSYVSGLRPSQVRVCRHGCTCDASSWRVTIWIDQNDLVRRIEQEVQVSLFSFANGHELALALKENQSNE